MLFEVDENGAQTGDAAAIVIDLAVDHTHGIGARRGGMNCRLRAARIAAADRHRRLHGRRDRGYRGLSFEGLQDLPVRPVTDETFTTLALDEAGRPVGIDGFRAGDSLRTVIDLTLTSPHGIAVQVDDEGRATGFVHHHDVVDLLEKRR